ncbi:MAG: PAS domain-containing protein [Acidobacteria bacterium]|nr:MAG: PAS domain-containing protein [Acidobacteriota bacterium]
MEDTAKNKDRINLIWVGVGFGAFYWVLESVRDVLAFGKGTLPERLFFPDLTSVWMRLLIIGMIILYGCYAQSVRVSIQEKGRGRRIFGSPVIVSGFIFALAYWVLEAARDVFIFKRGNLLTQLVYPDIPDLSVRLLAVCVLVLFSLYVQNLINERRALEESMRQRHEELEKLVEERTTELRKANELLREEMDGRKKLETALWISRKCFQDIVNTTTEGIVVVDNNHKIRFANLAFQSMCGRKAEDITGEPFSLPLTVGQVGRVMVKNLTGATEVEMRVMESEWEGTGVYLVLLHPVDDSETVDGW